MIHLSEIHSGNKNKSKDINTIDTLENMVDQFISLYNKDEHIVIIAGDILDNAKKKDQVQETMGQLQRIQNAGFNILIAPGNHDYGIGSNTFKEGMINFKNAGLNNQDQVSPKFDKIDDIAFM